MQSSTAIILLLNYNMIVEHSPHLVMHLPCVSDSALSALEKDGNIASVIEEAEQNSKNFQFSSMMCMFGLATVIGCTIQSYFPISNETAPKEQWNSLAKMYNCTIKPRFGQDPTIIHIFRCAALPSRYLVDRKIPELKNHFVALCLPEQSVAPGDQYFVPHLSRPITTIAPRPASTTSTSIKTTAKVDKPAEKMFPG
jgi:hypothetical protein